MRNDARTIGDKPAATRIQGVVVRILKDKGFGFIRIDEGAEYFFHMSNCDPGTWEEITAQPKDGIGTPITFEPTTTAKGLRALAVQI